MWKAIMLICFVTDGGCARGEHNELFATLDECIEQTEVMFEVAIGIIQRRQLGEGSINVWCENVTAGGPDVEA